MRALQFATATANLASQNAFLFLATHGPIFIASSSSATLIRCGFQYCRWNCSPAERRQRICDHLERPRRQRGERRSELRAAIGRGIGWQKPFAREHHGDEQLEPLRTNASVSMAHNSWHLSKHVFH
jgi:hypothetical protein